MGLDGKLITVGLVLVATGPILGLILRRLWRGEAHFHGFWVAPRAFKAKDRRGNGGERTPD